MIKEKVQGEKLRIYIKEFTTPNQISEYLMTDYMILDSFN